jgi:hypothetical protein
MFRNKKAVLTPTVLALIAFASGMLLSGCSKQLSAPAASTPAVQPHAFTIIQAQSDTYLLDTVVGKVWRLEKSFEGVHFVPVDVTAVRGVGTGMSAEQCAKSEAEFAKFGGVASCTLGIPSEKVQNATPK